MSNFKKNEFQLQYPFILKKMAGLVGLLFLVLSLQGFFGESQNGFDLSKHSVPLNEIRSGGPPRDGIPAILKPTQRGVRLSTVTSSPS